MSQDQIAAPARDAREVLRFAVERARRPRHVVLGMTVHPGVIETGVIRHEVEHQLETPPPQAVAQAIQGGVSAERSRNRVARNRKPGARDVLESEIRQRPLEFVPPLFAAARHVLTGRPGLPDAQHPDPVESQGGEAIQFRVRDVVERRRPADQARQLRQPDPGVDLQQDRMRHVVHVCGALS